LMGRRRINFREGGATRKEVPPPRKPPPLRSGDFRPALKGRAQGASIPTAVRNRERGPMPWITKAGKRKFVIPPCPAGVPHGPLPPGVTERDPAAHAQRRWEHEEFWRWWKHVVADYLEMGKYCPRIACRRAKACVDKDARCHDEALPVLKETFYAGLHKLPREERS
jgi:hypothetical protein